MINIDTARKMTELELLDALQTSDEFVIVREGTKDLVPFTKGDGTTMAPPCSTVIKTSCFAVICGQTLLDRLQCVPQMAWFAHTGDPKVVRAVKSSKRYLLCALSQNSKIRGSSQFLDPSTCTVYGKDQIKMFLKPETYDREFMALPLDSIIAIEPIISAAKPAPVVAPAPQVVQQQGTSQVDWSAPIRLVRADAEPVVAAAPKVAGYQSLCDWLMEPVQAAPAVQAPAVAPVVQRAPEAPRTHVVSRKMSPLAQKVAEEAELADLENRYRQARDPHGNGGLDAAEMARMTELIDLTTFPLPGDHGEPVQKIVRTEPHPVCTNYSRAAFEGALALRAAEEQELADLQGRSDSLTPAETIRLQDLQVKYPPRRQRREMAGSFSERR